MSAIYASVLKPDTSPCYKNSITISQLLRLLVFICFCFVNGLTLAQQPGTIPAFLPMKDAVPRMESLAIDGDWRISSIGKTIRIDAGRAYALDRWLHLFVLSIEPNMVVIQNIKSDGRGGYVGDDLPLMGRWQARRATDGALDVTVAGAMGPVNYRLLPVDPLGVDVGEDYRDDNDEPDVDEPPEYGGPAETPEEKPGKGGGKVVDIGRRCYEDFKPMGGAMLKYASCQQGLGQINALKKAMQAKDVEGIRGIIDSATCRSELKNLVDTISRKGFKSFSLGASGEFGAIVSGSTQLFVAMNLDLTKTTLYASVGGSFGSQIGASANGVVSAYYNKANKLSGGGKSFAVALKALGGVGGEVGLSSGRSPRCESFSVSAGAGAEADAGSVGVSQTIKVIDIPFIHKPDFTPSCKNVTLKATNRTGKEIKIVDLDFYDYDNKRWRSKVTKNRNIAKNKKWIKKFRLQKIGGDKTKVRYQYRVRLKDKGLKQWSKVVNQKTSKLTCKDGMTISTDLTKKK